MGGPSSFVAWADFDDVPNSLGVNSTGQAGGSFAWVEVGCIGANKGAARDEADHCGSSLP